MGTSIAFSFTNVQFIDVHGYCSNHGHLIQARGKPESFSSRMRSSRSLVRSLVVSNWIAFSAVPGRFTVAGGASSISINQAVAGGLAMVRGP